MAKKGGLLSEHDLATNEGGYIIPLVTRFF